MKGTGCCSCHLVHYLQLNDSEANRGNRVTHFLVTDGSGSDEPLLGSFFSAITFVSFHLQSGQANMFLFVCDPPVGL